MFGEPFRRISFDCEFPPPMAKSLLPELSIGRASVNECFSFGITPNSSRTRPIGERPLLGRSSTSPVVKTCPKLAVCVSISAESAVT